METVNFYFKSISILLFVCHDISRDIILDRLVTCLFTQGISLSDSVNAFLQDSLWTPSAATLYLSTYQEDY